MPQSVSCVVMAYNEEATIEAAVRDVHDALSATGRSFEILVVDDGSTDGTAAIGAELERAHPEVRLIRHGANRGPGSAIFTGIREARCDLVAFHPADGQVAFADVAAALDLLDDADLVVFRRSGRPGYSRGRLWTSAGYIRLAHALFGLHRWDDLNFVYLYRRALVADMPIDSRGVFMCTEILVRALDRGARVAGASARCLPRTAGVSAVYRPRVIARTAYDMGRFWWRRRARKRSAAGPTGPTADSVPPEDKVTRRGDPSCSC